MSNSAVPRTNSLSPAPRVLLLRDFAEEGWVSMDLVAEMLSSALTTAEPDLAVTNLLPHYAARAVRVPGLPQRLARNMDRAWNRYVSYPRQIRPQCSEYDVFHVVDHSYAHLVQDLPAGRAVVTCHDIDIFRCLVEPEREARPYWFRRLAARVLAGLRQAAHVLCVSEAVRHDLQRHNLLAGERVTVVHNGVAEEFTQAPGQVAEERIAALVADCTGPLLLHVGSTIPRKRIDVLLQVFAAVRREIPDVWLLRVGGDLTPQQNILAHELGVAPAIRTLPFLSRTELAAVYRRADLVIQPSGAEGFGLPVAEAMACGTPVVASDLPVLREVGGAAATYCPVGEVPVWSAAVVPLLSESRQAPGRFQARRQAAQAQAARFTWAETARKTLGVYREVLRQGKAAA